MIDLHYDLLSILYYSYVKNDFSYVETIQQRLKDSGVTGVVANLYFMNEDEMKEELGEYYKPIDVVEMFQIATSLLPKYFPVSGYGRDSGYGFFKWNYSEKRSA